MIGAVLGTRYRILEQLGEGSMGQVYLAEHLDLGRQEAIKVLQPTVAIDPAFVSRFRREARATNRVQHPNIVSVYDFGQLPDGRMFLAMEYAEGVPLDRLIRSQGPMTVPRMLHVVHQLASAIGHAHDRGVVHRDLKPPNMILVEHRGHEDVLKILDFGIAKIVAPDYEESVKLTRDGEIFGTPEYMAPEQFLVQDTTPLIDIYAVGCIAFELLTGEPPFRGRLIELIHAHTRGPRPVPSTRRPDGAIPPALDELVVSCLAIDPADRPQSAAQLDQALQALQGFPHKASATNRKSRGRISHSLEEIARSVVRAVDGGAATSGAAVSDDGARDDLATADTAFMPQSEVLASMQEALLDLAEGLLDHGAVATHVTQLTVAVANMTALRDDLARLDDESEHLDAAEARIEQATREREGPLRFAIGELRFDADGAADDTRADLTYQIGALKTRLRALLADSDHQLDEITGKRISLAVDRANLEERQGAAMDDMRALVDGLLATCELPAEVVTLVAHYVALRDLVDAR